MEFIDSQNFTSLNKLIEYETQLLTKIIKLKDLYKFKTCLVKYGTDLKPHREYTIREFVWGFIKDPSLANEVAISLEAALVDIRDEPPTMVVPAINVKTQLCGIQYSIHERYNEIKGKLTNKNTLIIFQTGNELYEMFYEDALIGRDLFQLNYDEEELCVFISENELPEVIRGMAGQDYDVIIYSVNCDGSDVRVNHITSLMGQQLTEFQ